MTAKSSYLLAWPAFIIQSIQLFSFVFDPHFDWGGSGTKPALQTISFLRTLNPSDNFRKFLNCFFFLTVFFFNQDTAFILFWVFVGYMQVEGCLSGILLWRYKANQTSNLEGHVVSMLRVLVIIHYLLKYKAQWH